VTVNEAAIHLRSGCLFPAGTRVAIAVHCRGRLREIEGKVVQTAWMTGAWLHECRLAEKLSAEEVDEICV